MKKIVVLGMGLCVALAFSSCKSSESAYKKAYEKAKQQELAEAATANETPVETVAPVAPVTTAPVTSEPVAPTAPVREENRKMAAMHKSVIARNTFLLIFIPVFILELIFLSGSPPPYPGSHWRSHPDASPVSCRSARQTPDRSSGLPRSFSHHVPCPSAS